MHLPRLQGTTLNVFMGIIGAMAFALQGYDQSVMNGLLTLDSFIKTFPAIDVINADEAQKSHRSLIQGKFEVETVRCVQLTMYIGTVVALYEVGCAVGALSCAFVGDTLGRRRTIFAAACILLIGIIIQSSPYELGQLIAGRVITGNSGYLI